MIDLKMSEKTAKKEYGLGTPSKEDMPRYPYGTTLRFTKEQIEKIDVLDNAKVGDVFNVMGIAKVVSVSARDGEKRESSRDIELQMQKIEIMPPASAKKKMRKEIMKEVFKD